MVDEMGVSEPTTNGPPPGLNGSGSLVSAGDGFGAVAALMALLADPAAATARLGELERRQNAVSAAEARLAKRERQIEAREADLAVRVKAHLDEKRADKEKFAADWAQLAYDRKEWAERCGDIEAQAHRYREGLRVDIDLSNPSHMARLHNGHFSRAGQLEEAQAARRSPADVAAERAVAETPEFEAVKGTSITRGGGAGRRG
jgi:hypothetical protein